MTFPRPDNFPSFSHGVGHFSPFHHHRPPIYSIKRSTVNVYKIDIEVDRLGSEVRVSASFQIFALTAGGNVSGGEGNCPGGELLLSEGICPTLAYTVHVAPFRVNSADYASLVQTDGFPAVLSHRFILSTPGKTGERGVLCGRTPAVVPGADTDSTDASRPCDWRRRNCSAPRRPDDVGQDATADAIGRPQRSTVHLPLRVA